MKHKDSNVSKANMWLKIVRVWFKWRKIFFGKRPIECETESEYEWGRCLAWESSCMREDLVVEKSTRERTYMAHHRHDICLYNEREDKEATLSDYSLGVVTWLYRYESNDTNAGSGHIKYHVYKLQGQYHLKKEKWLDWSKTFMKAIQLESKVD